MMRKLLLAMMIWLSFVGLCMAESWELNLDAGPTSVSGGVHYKRSLANGFMKAGASGLYTDNDDTEYKWAEFSFTVGSDTIQPGLSCEVGFRGILGDAEDNSHSGDIGALAFTGHAGYLFPRWMVPIPLEVFADLTYAPEPLSFRDTEDYLSMDLGIALRIIQNASVLLEYSLYEVDMESGPGDWTLDEGAIRLGILMRF